MHTQCKKYYKESCKITGAECGIIRNRRNCYDMKILHLVSVTFLRIVFFLRSFTQSRGESGGDPVLNLKCHLKSHCIIVINGNNMSDSLTLALSG